MPFGAMDRNNVVNVTLAYAYSPPPLHRTIRIAMRERAKRIFHDGLK